MNLLQFVLGQTWASKDQVPANVREHIAAEVATLPGSEAYQEGFRRAATVEEFDAWLQKLVDHCRAEGIDLG